MKKLDKKSVEAIIPLTSMQEGMLFHHLREPGSELHFEQLSLQISGTVDRKIYEKAWDYTVRNNQTLRTVFRWDNVKTPVQVILKKHGTAHEYYDFSGAQYSDSDKKKLSDRVRLNDREKKFDLNEVPFRVTLCKTRADAYEMIVSNHHILYDGWSNGIILKEFFKAYRDLSGGNDPSPPPVKANFKEFVQTLRGRETAEDRKFWEAYLGETQDKKAGESPTEPLRRKKEETRAVGNYKMRFDKQLRERLEEFARRQRITQATLLYCAWGILLQNYFHREDVLFDTSVSGRNAKIKGIENSAGLFINTLPLRLKTHPLEKITDALRRFHNALREREAFNDTSQAILKECLEEYRWEAPFDSIVVIENYPLDNLLTDINGMRENNPLSITSYSVFGTTAYDLTLIFTKIDHIELTVTYDNRLFDEDKVTRLSRYYSGLLENMTANPEKPVGEIGIFPEFPAGLDEKIPVRGPGEVSKAAKYAAPRDPVEEQLAVIWGDLLTRGGSAPQMPIGIDDDFFDFGGHSLKAALLTARLHKAFNVKVPLAEVFRSPTIRKLARYITGAAEDRYDPIQKAEKKEYYAASSAQKRMYALQQIEPGSIAYNVSNAFIPEGPLEKTFVVSLENAFRKLIKRHEGLRTSFDLVDGEPVQIIHPEKDVDFSIKYVEIGSFIKPFCLKEIPLIRAGLVKREEGKHLLLFDAHHIISDGVSMDIVIKELAVYYAGDTGAALPEPGIQYKDFSEWQNAMSVSGKFKHRAEYWQNIFAGEIPVSNLPTDYPRSPDRTAGTEGHTLNFRIDKETTQKIRSIEKTGGVTLYMILLAAYNVLSMKYSGREDVVVGTITDGRSHPDVQNIVGVMITTLAMRNYPNREKPFLDFLKEVKTNSLHAFENADYPFEELLKTLRLNREVNRNPLFDTMFLLQNYEWTDLSLKDGPVLKPYDFKAAASTFELRITAVEAGEEIDIEIQYASKLFKEDTIQRLAGHYINILNRLCDDPHKKLGEVELLSGKEKQQILIEFNATGKNVGVKKTVCQLFEDRVTAAPHETAVDFNNETVSYEQLNKNAHRLAALLKRKGVAPARPVGILLPRSVQMVESIFAVWKAGGAYIPMDPQYPAQRIKEILKDSAAGHILSLAEIVEPELETACEGKIIKLDRIREEDPTTGETGYGTAPDPDGPAYIIYTSGSTGKPKGAGVYHRGLFNLMQWFVTEFQLNTGDGNLLITSLSFDLTQKNIFAPLITGGKLTLSPVNHFDPAIILRYIGEKKITWLNCTPGMIYKLVEFSDNKEIERLASLRYVFLGGEPISVVLLGKWLDSPSFNAEIVNTYGPTECTDICAYHRIPHPGEYIGKTVPIGKPIYNARLYILDPSFLPVPLGVPGELFIGGEGVGMGYINDTPKTSGKFFTPPFLANRRSTRLLYRTGDLVKWLPGGNIEFIDRIDHQVKIRGFRIEPGEIEARLSGHDKIKRAVVLALDRAPDKYLCAYFVPREPLEISHLKDYLSERLPQYMIPSHFIPVKQIPLTPNGKVNGKLLPVPHGKNMDTGDTAGEYVPPGSDTEKILVESWQEILEKKRVGIEDNFFELGGDSLLAIQAIARLREAFCMDLPVRAFFEHPTIKALAKKIETREPSRFHIPKAPEGVDIPLSFPQESLWFLQQLDDRNTAYFVPRVVRITGKLDPGIIEKTFNEIIRRHEILRTVFPNIDGRPVQRILPPHDFRLPLIDLTHIGGAGQSREVGRWLSEEGRRPFRFEKGPVLRITLLKLKPEEHLLVTTEHHLVHDGWTQGVLLKEFIAIFTAYFEGKPSPLPELPIQYADFAYWQRDHMKGEELEKRLDYWKAKLAGSVPVLNLPTDRPRPPAISGNGAEHRLFLSKELSDALDDFGRKKGTTLFMTMITAFKILLYRYTGTGDLCVGTGTAGRRYKEMEGMLGMVINTLALRTQISGELSVSDCLHRVKTTCLEAYAQEDTPFEKVVEALQPERSLSYTPIFQVCYGFMNTPGDSLRLPGLELEVQAAHNRSSKFDINIVVEPPSEERMHETGGRIEILWEYNTDIFDDETMTQMLTHYVRLLEEIVRDTDPKISALPILDQFERRQLLYRWNDTGDSNTGERSVVDLFDEQMEKTPHGTAVTSLLNVNRNNITYKELGKRSDRWAWTLRNKNVTPGTIVGIMADRSMEMIVGMLAVLKAGGVYLPILSKYPGERIAYMLNDSGARILLVSCHTSIDGCLRRLSEGQGEAPLGTPITLREKGYRHCKRDGTLLSQKPGGIKFDGEIIDLFEKKVYGKEGEERVENIPFPRLTPADPAYVIYTSGSTGKPKGVLVGHGNISRLVKNPNYIRWVPGDRLLMTGAMVFDITTFEIWGPLLNGLNLCLPGENVIMDAAQMQKAIVENKISILHLIPQLFNQLAARDPRMFAPLNYLLVGGDLVRPRYIDIVRERCKDLKILHMYGPTENTTFSTFHLVGKTQKDRIPIGMPLRNSSAIIVDEYGGLQPLGVTGELCAGGRGLAAGYLNNPGLTAEKFVENPFAPGEKMYRTGDLARRLRDGNIEFLGRRDHQVKIRGFRIELGEIEKQLTRHEKVKEAVVLSRDNENGDKYLCAYTVPHPGEMDAVEAPPPTAAELREYLAELLPDYMIPAYFVSIDNVPLTPNGKIDGNALPGPEIVKGEGHRAPRNEVERKLSGIWSEVLGIENEIIGIDSNFFELGGHSLNATSAVSFIRREFNVEFPLSQVFSAPRLRDFARFIRGAVESTHDTIEPVEKREYYPQSSAQKRLFFLDYVEDIGTSYHIPIVLKVDGEIDEKRFERAFKDVIQRHESLRTSFHLIHNQPVQKVHHHVEFEMEYYESAGDLIDNFIRPFDLSRAPLIRFGIGSLPEGEHLLLGDVHHIISDGASMVILVREFTRLYAGESLPEPDIQYKDFSQWHNRRLQSGRIKFQEEYWLKRFRGEDTGEVDVPVLNLPTDYPRPQRQDFRGGCYEFEVGGDDTAAFKALTAESGATLFMNLSAAFNVLLHKYTDQEDIIVGTGISGRHHSDLHNIFGFFLNVLPLRNFPRPGKTYREFLHLVKDNCIAAFDNQDFQFEELVGKLKLERDPTRGPLFDIIFTFHDSEEKEIRIDDGLVFSPYRFDRKTSQFDIVLDVFERTGTVFFRMVYAAALFKPSTIERIARQYLDIIHWVARHPDTLLKDIEISHELLEAAAAIPVEAEGDFGF